MNRTITYKNSSLKGSTLRYHNLVIAHHDTTTGILRLNVLASDRACHTRVNQFLKQQNLPVVLEVNADHKTAYLLHRETKKDIASGEFPSWNSPHATIELVKQLGGLGLKKAA